MEEIASGYGLIEGPVWDAAQGLYFSDVMLTAASTCSITRVRSVRLYRSGAELAAWRCMSPAGLIDRWSRYIVRQPLVMVTADVLLDRAAADQCDRLQ